MPATSNYPEIWFCFIGEPMVYADGVPLALELNLLGLTVGCDLDDASLSDVDPDALLVTIRDHWANYIRADWAAGMDKAG